MLPPPSCRAWQGARPSAGCPLQPWQILCNTEDFCHWVVPWGLAGRRTLDSGEEQCMAQFGQPAHSFHPLTLLFQPAQVLEYPKYWVRKSW